MIRLQFLNKHLAGFLSEEEINLMQDEIDLCHCDLVEKAGKGNRFLGWMDLSLKTEDALLDSIEADAKAIRQKSEILVLIGIGGYSLGARAIIEALSSPFSNLNNEKGNPVVVYAGNNLSSDYLADLLFLLDRKEYAIVVVAESAAAIETAVAFRLLRSHIEKKYGVAEAASRIFVVTDGSKGTLKILAEKHNFKTYTIPEDVSGPYSALTAAGLLPVAIAGFDIRLLMQGATEMRKVCMETSSIPDNPAARYAAIRNLLYRLGSQVEILVNYEPSLHYFTEWWKQLFGESEGKENEGIFPSAADFTGDIHSIGQYIQEGQRMLFETVVHILKPKHQLIIPADDDKPDGLDYLAGKTLHEINALAAIGTSLEHSSVEVPNLDILLPAIDEQSLGELIYFFEFACALSGYLLGIDPFKQPATEMYQRNLFALLGKPGFENETEKIRRRLNEE